MCPEKYRRRCTMCCGQGWSRRHCSQQQTGVNPNVSQQSNGKHVMIQSNNGIQQWKRTTATYTINEFTHNVEQKTNMKEYIYDSKWSSESGSTKPYCSGMQIWVIKLEKSKEKISKQRNDNLEGACRRFLRCKQCSISSPGCWLVVLPRYHCNYLLY